MGFELIMELRTVFMNAFHKYMHAPLKLPTSGYIMIHLCIENAGKLWNCL